MNTPDHPADAPISDAAIDAAIPQFAEEPLVGYVSVPEFLRRVPNDQPWQLPNVIKFGTTVGNLAKSMGVAYLTTSDPALGTVQVFPEAMMVRVYKYLAPALGWPRIVDLLPRDKASVEAALRVKQTMASQLTVIASTAQESDLRMAARTLLRVVERECIGLQKEMQSVQLRGGESREG